LTPGLGGAQALGAGSGAALTMGLGSSTLAIIGGENVTSGTQVVQFGATTFLVDPTFNIVNPSSGAITQLNLGAITGGTFTPTLTGNGRFTQTGVLTSTGGFTLAAGFSGLATLNQANAYTGVTTVNGGVLAFSTSGNLGNASATNRIQLGRGKSRALRHDLPLCLRGSRIQDDQAVAANTRRCGNSLRSGQQRRRPV